MANNELFNVLRLLSKEEIKKFGKFLDSPYFGHRKQALRLYNELVKYYPLFTHVNLESKKLAEKISGVRKFKETYIRNLFSDLHAAALDFMRIESFERTSLDKYNFLHNELLAKGLHDEFNKTIKKIDNEENELADWSYFLNKHILETNKFNSTHYNTKLKNTSNLLEEISYINNSVKYLFYYFICNFFSMYTNFLFYKTSFNIKIAKQNIDKFIEIIDFRKIKSIMANDRNSFIIDLYVKMILLFKEFENNKHFFSYLGLFKQSIHKLSKNEINIGYYLLTGYCSLKIFFSSKSSKIFNRELFILYNEMLENEYYLDRNTRHLSHEVYRNILFHGIRIKNYEWLAGYVKKYSYKVFPSDRDNMYFYGSAYLHYNMGNHAKALESINRIEQDFFIYKIDVKNLTLMIYYELGYVENALSLLKAYKEHVRNNKLLTEERQTRYLNFAKYLDKLILKKAGTLRQDIDYIKHNLENDNDVAYKSWLLEKISEFDMHMYRSA